MDSLTSAISEDRKHQIFGHTLRVYDALYEAGKDEEINGRTLRIFRGKVLDLYRSLGVSQSHYTKVFRFLRETGAIEQAQRGRRGHDSIIVLHGRPNQEALERLALEVLTNAPDAATLSVQRQIADIERRLGGLDVVKALHSIEQRLSTVEAEVAKSKR